MTDHDRETFSAKLTKKQKDMSESAVLSKEKE